MAGIYMAHATQFGLAEDGEEEEMSRVRDRREKAREAGAVVRERREELALTQAELAAEAGVSVDVVSRLENGRRLPHAGNLRKLAGVLGVGVERMTTGRGADGREPRSGSRVGVRAAGAPNEEAASLLESWMDEDAAYDEEALPELMRSIDEDRPSHRKLFGRR